MLILENYDLVIESDLDYKKALEACISYFNGAKLGKLAVKQYKTLPCKLLDQIGRCELESSNRATVECQLE